MARLLAEGSWFEGVRSQSWYEREFEDVVVDRASQLFPRWICVKFIETVEGDDGTRKQPDLALIDEHYREWWVVEVELAHHDLRNHILPQVHAFRTGRYGEQHTQALCRRAPDLEVDRLTEMMLGEPPNVIVIADSPAVIHIWRPALREVSVALGVVEPFRGPGNELILRLNGDQPEPPGEILTRCSRHQQVRRLWKVHSPAALPPGLDVFEIEYAGVTAQWARVTLQDAVLLQPVRGEVLEGLSLAELVRREDDSLAFQPILSARTTRRNL
jgi:hypothetical protein